MYISYHSQLCDSKWISLNLLLMTAAVICHYMCNYLYRAIDRFTTHSTASQHNSQSNLHIQLNTTAHEWRATGKQKLNSNTQAYMEYQCNASQGKMRTDCVISMHETYIRTDLFSGKPWYLPQDGSWSVGLSLAGLVWAEGIEVKVTRISTRYSCVAPITSQTGCSCCWLRQLFK